MLEKWISHLYLEVKMLFQERCLLVSSRIRLTDPYGTCKSVKSITNFETVGNGMEHVLWGDSQQIRRVGVRIS